MGQPDQSSNMSASTGEVLKPQANEKNTREEYKEFMVSTPIARVRSSDGSQKLVTCKNVKKSSQCNKSQSSGSNKKGSNENKTRDGGRKSKTAGEVKSAEVNLIDNFAKKAEELKAGIKSALDNQTRWHESKATAEASELTNLRAIVSDFAVEDTEDQDHEDVGGSEGTKAQSGPSGSGGLVEVESKVVHEKSAQLDVCQQADSVCCSLANGETNRGSSEQQRQQLDLFGPLMAKMDSESKVMALSLSLQKQLASSPQMLEMVCRKLVEMSEANRTLAQENDNRRVEQQKLLLVRDKLEKLCRELQKSNNSIRIESLDLIKSERIKAKDQAAKIQSTLAGVMKLFDENQQRNLALKQENLDLQTKLRALLEHCDAWEKSVHTTLKQRELENELVRTEMAKANLLAHEEKERFLDEKKGLLRALSLMQEQQHKIESQEAKLRTDLANYATKYDECQSAISAGLNKFQQESKRMLKQLEKSRQDYVSLLSKYEASNKRIAQLHQEKQSWDKSTKVANKKIDTLERLCRALQASHGNVVSHESDVSIECIVSEHPEREKLSTGESGKDDDKKPGDEEQANENSSDHGIEQIHSEHCSA